MTLRERIADWLTGGALTRARMCCHMWCEFNTEKAEALRQIATSPGAYSSNGTLRRVIRIAREALGE